MVQGAETGEEGQEEATALRVVVGGEQWLAMPAHSRCM